jgi:hypothetical protein
MLIKSHNVRYRARANYRRNGPSYATSPRALCFLIHPIGSSREPNPEPPHHCRPFIRVFRAFRGKQNRSRTHRELVPARHFLHSHPTNTRERRREGLPPGEDDIGGMRTAISQKSISRLILTVYN